MADSQATIDAQYDDDFATHEHTYQGFLRILKWCVAAIVIILVLLAWIFL